MAGKWTFIRDIKDWLHDDPEVLTTPETRNSELYTETFVWDGTDTEKNSRDILVSSSPDVLIYVDNEADQGLTITIETKLGTDDYAPNREDNGDAVVFEIGANEAGVYGPFIGPKFEGGRLNVDAGTAPTADDETSITVQEI